MATLYEELKAAGIETSNWQSDLYFPATPKALEILDKHPLQKSNATRFMDNITGAPWVDVPFAFIPYWDREFKH